MSKGTQALTIHQAMIQANRVIGALQPHCHRIQVAGSIRRGVAWVNDIEIVCIPKAEWQTPPADLFGQPTGTAKLVRPPGYAEAIRSLATEIVKGRNLDEAKYTQFMMDGVKVDVFTARPETWGYILAIRTGPREYSAGLGARWTKLGYKGDGGALTMYGKLVEIREERDLFDRLGIKYTPPNER